MVHLSARLLLLVCAAPGVLSQPDNDVNVNAEVSDEDLATAQGSGSGSGSGYDPVTENPDLPDCMCQASWSHNEYMCNASNGWSKGGPVQMTGCPSLKALGQCEWDPDQSWCLTTETNCKQQVGDMEGKGWAFCTEWKNAPDGSGQADEPQGELPLCTCKSSWQFSEGICANNPMTMNGCPSLDQIKQCIPNATDLAQSWCTTNEALCREQEDNTATIGTAKEMVGMGWSYCSAVDQETELPACECEQSWTLSVDDCRNGSAREQNVGGCPTIKTISQCEGGAAYDDTDQTWCETTFQRCREQTWSTVADIEDQVNNSWAYCSPETQTAEWPDCECLAEWTHASNDCKQNTMTMHGCPDLATLAVCDGDDVRQSWCDTTFETCEQQNSEADGKEWAYCDTSTGMGDLAECECKGSWTHRTDDCNPFEGGTPQSMRGCPSLERIQRCEPNAYQSWCETTDQNCKGQIGQEVDSGWVACDPATQYALDRNDTNVGGIIATSVAVTFLVCALALVGLVLLWRKWANRRKADYSELTQMRLVPSGAYVP